MIQRIKVVKEIFALSPPFTAFHAFSNTSPSMEEVFHIPSPFGGGRERERPLHRDMLDYVPTLS
ncbi:MAG: hypothetical protein IKN48_08440 [Bacteroidaceae bacterium]|nr:hypothetical protein [Bacteroidaceae bacterium]